MSLARPSVRGALAFAAVLVGGVGAAAPLTAHAAPTAADGLPPRAAATGRVEIPIVSASAQSDVAASLVKLHAPLDATAAPHPPACDWLQFMRFRRRAGPVDPAQADAVAVLMPGNLEGATAFDPVARNAVREAARRGQTIEVWATDRRSNCLEDLTGLDHLEATGDRAAAAGYYAGTRALNGRTFDGWRHEPKVLADLGVAQTVRDFHAVLTRELPSQPWREQHVICGGHSLGGGILEAFAGWDFDGDRATTADAGYRQCAGFVGFETVLDIGLTSDGPPAVRALAPLLPALQGGFGDWAPHALKGGTLLRHEELLGIGPETMAFMETVATLAATHPNEDATPWLRSIAGSQKLRDYLHLAGSASLAEFLTTRASLTQLRFTFAGLLGQMFDDNASPLSVIRASFGYPEGAPLIRNRLPEQVAGFPGLDLLFQPGRVMLPRRTSPQALSSWRNYDALGSLGAGVTTPASEVTDAATFARIMHEGPTNLVESWFPTRIVTDLVALASGARRGTLAPAIHPHPTRRRPRLVILGGDGVIRKAHIRPLDPHVVLPGYEHLDVLTAAERQNNGRPEGSSQALVEFIQQATTGAATRLSSPAPPR